VGSNSRGLLVWITAPMPFGFAVSIVRRQHPQRCNQDALSLLLSH
jgi:hypothetical protein